jgi:hypothetical protein
MRNPVPEKGQSTTEFVLIAPFLFLTFFCIIQFSYLAYVSLAVQRAALAIARKASLSGVSDQTAFKAHLAISLLPIANLSQKTLLTILETKFHAFKSQDGKQMVARVSYPMPIWVPLARNVFGTDLIASSDYNESPEGQAIKSVFALMGKPEPNLSFQGEHFPVRWITYEESTFNEGYHE